MRLRGRRPPARRGCTGTPGRRRDRDGSAGHRRSPLVCARQRHRMTLGGHHVGIVPLLVQTVPRRGTAPGRRQDRHGRVGAAWLGREDSNLRVAESKSAALPLGDAPPAPLLNRSRRARQQGPCPARRVLVRRPDRKARGPAPGPRRRPGLRKPRRGFLLRKPGPGAARSWRVQGRALALLSEPYRPAPRRRLRPSHSAVPSPASARATDTSDSRAATASPPGLCSAA